MTRRPASGCCKLLLAVWLLAQAGLLPQEAQCSSYLGDYFLPTAKLALNKLQQSFSAKSEDARSADASGPQSAPVVAGNATPPETRQLNLQVQKEEEPRRADEPPNKNEFVKLETTPDLAIGNNLVQNAQKASAPAGNQPVLVVASTEATESDPTSVVPSATAPELAAPEPVGPTAGPVPAQPDEGARREPPSEPDTTDRVVISELPTAASDPPPTPAMAGGAQEKQAPQVEQTTSGPVPAVAEEAAKETELEAVAAVDASIGFGDLFASLSDSCYDEYGNARYCEPEFENAAFEKQVEVSSECGSPASRFCTSSLNERNEQICHMCDAQYPHRRHPAAYLTDMNNSNSPTCWVSAPISVRQNESSGELDETRSDNVSLVLNLEKKYEITYVSMQFCNHKPDSLAIFKSSDFGQSWQPYHFYSSQCRRMYGRQSRAAPAPGELEPRCTNISQPVGRQAASSDRLAFSALEGRSVGPLALERSPALQEWITATNIKLVFDRHQASWLRSGLGLAHRHSAAGNQQQAQQRANQNSSAAETENSLTSPSDTYNYAMSDLTVGGRCKCNGHASRCVHNKEGLLQCDCRHNTAGRDCEKCAALHHDRPWTRATQFDANPCQPCNCNGHSRKCHFDAELYRLSGRRSGGVCTYCKDNTAGRHCHYCKEGFTRDHSRPMSDKEACKHCDCHPIGSLGRVCNQTTGQCPCKEGVAGLQCNRCLAGYQQSSSLLEPCIKLPENDINSNPAPSADEEPPTGASGDIEPAPEPAADPNHIGADSARRAPPGEARLNGNRIDDSEPDNPDKDDDSELATGKDEINLARKHMLAQPSRFNRKQHYATNYYRPHSAHRSRHQFSREPVEDDEEGLSALQGERALEDEYRYLPARYQPKPIYGGYTKPRYTKEFGSPARASLAGRARPGEPALVPSVASLDQADDLDLLEEPNGQSNYQLAGSAFYADDTFNQIQTPQATLRQLQAAQRRHSAARHRFSGQNEPQSPPSSSNNELACGDCQSSTRRLAFRQFCHLHFAVKAAILSKYVADDWTKFEVEIQDIFKSAPPAYADNMVQADEPELAKQRFVANQTASASASAPEGAAGQHRLKVGTVHPIWVPTEDLACKCPRLKLRSSYLLMGSVDAKENSANSLQLDRHGVALEWRSSLQEKLVKYQRRAARGRC